MKVKSIFIAFFLTITSFGAFSQGYMGNRFMINVEAVVSPSYFNPNFYGEKGYLAFNYIFSPNIEIIAWKKGTVGLVGHFLTSQYQRSILDDINIWVVGTENIPFKAFGYGVFYKQYLFDGRAPVGTYIKAECDFFHHQYFEKPEGEYDFMFGMKFEMGQDYLFFNRLKFSMGMSLGFTTKGWKFRDEYLDPLSDHLAASQNRMLGLYWLGFKVGLGLLAF